MKSIPIKCMACDHPMQVAVVCDHCRSLAPAEQLDYFAIFGLAPEFDLDTDVLRDAYYRASRVIHPDRLATEPVDDARGLRLSAKVNEAYKVLRDPIARAGYLLELQGGASAEHDRRVAPEVLSDTLELRERIEDAGAARDAAGLAAIEREIDQKRRETEDAVTSLARKLPGDAELRDRLRVELNTIRYWHRLTEDLAAAQDVVSSG